MTERQQAILKQKRKARLKALVGWPLVTLAALILLGFICTLLDPGWSERTGMAKPSVAEIMRRMLFCGLFGFLGIRLLMQASALKREARAISTLCDPPHAQVGAQPVDPSIPTKEGRLTPVVAVKLAVRAGGGSVVGELKALRRQISSLPERHASDADLAGGGVAQARQQFEVLCKVIEDAIRALEHGVDTHGSTISHADIARGLNRLVATVRRPQWFGLVSSILDMEGPKELQGCIDRINRVAKKIC